MDSNPIRNTDPLGDNVPFSPNANILNSGASQVTQVATKGAKSFSGLRAAINQIGGKIHSFTSNLNNAGGGGKKGEDPPKTKNDNTKTQAPIIPPNDMKLIKEYEADHDITQGTPIFGDGNYFERIRSKIITKAIKINFESSVRMLRIFRKWFELKDKLKPNKSTQGDQSPSDNNSIDYSLDSELDTVLKFTRPYLRHPQYRIDTIDFEIDKGGSYLDTIEKYEKHGYEFH